MNPGGDTQIGYKSISESVPKRESPRVDSENDSDEDYQEAAKALTPPTELRRGTRDRKPPSEWWNTTTNIALSARIVPQWYKSATSEENIDF